MARVTIRGSTLQVYSEPTASPDTMIGTLNNGDYIDVIKTKVVLSTVWARFSSDSFTNAWVIVKSPSVNYNYIDLGTKTRGAVIREQITRYDFVSKRIGDAITAKVSSMPNMPTASNADEDVTYGIKSSRKIITGDNEYAGKDYTATLTLGILNDGKAYPFISGTKNGKYVYDYATDYSDPTLQKALDLVRDSINMSLSEPKTLFRWGAENYNRFKVVNPNDLLTKAFPYVFFVRPSCELIDFSSGTSPTLGYNVKNNPLYNLYFKNCPEVIYSLVKNYGSNHNFMMALSNRAESFELKDRSLDTDTYGKTIRGNSISYGRNAEKSKAAGEFTVQYTDDYDLHILKIHELWLDYVEGVKNGKYTPLETNIINKVLDYAGSVFYFLCGPDGETIVYCAKYTGIFPSTIPDSALSYQKGNIINNPSYSVTYQYSWSEIDNPEIITDFNQMSAPTDYRAEAAYQPDILSTGTTWVGAPYIESIKQNDGSIQYKLRFRHLIKRGR